MKYKWQKKKTEIDLHRYFIPFSEKGQVTVERRR